jgi:hypothetical protein
VIDDGSAVFCGSEASDVAIAHVIHVDEDDVGFTGGGYGDEEREEDKKFHGLLEVAKSLCFWWFEDDFLKRDLSTTLA